MRPVLFPERTPEVEAWLADRSERRADRRDEMWDGTYVVAPAPHQRHGRIAARLIARLVPAADAVHLEVADLANVGAPGDYRIPAAVVYRPEVGNRPEPYLPSVELIVEIRSPGEDPMAKLPFYRNHGAREAVLVDPDASKVQWLARHGDDWISVDDSAVLERGVAGILADLLR